MRWSTRSGVVLLGYCPALLWISLLSTVTAVRLQISDMECFRENMESSESLISLTVASDDLYGRPVYFDVMVRAHKYDGEWKIDTKYSLLSVPIHIDSSIIQTISPGHTLIKVLRVSTLFAFLRSLLTMAYLNEALLFNSHIFNESSPRLCQCASLPCQLS
jgi:hypothetical protein